MIVYQISILFIDGEKSDTHVMNKNAIPCYHSGK